jgi:hypothetical protein
LQLLDFSLELLNLGLKIGSFWNILGALRCDGGVLGLLELLDLFLGCIVLSA